MKVLSLSTYDTGGGAHRAAFRLHQAMRSAGIDSWLLVQHPSMSDPAIIPATVGLPWLPRLAMHFGERIDRQPLAWYGPQAAQHPWSLNWMPNGVRRQIERLAPDIIHLNWVGSGFVPIRALARLGRPIVWTLHDSWAFTGGCHIPGDCAGFRQQCGRCPQLGSSREHDLSRWVWRRKHTHWSTADLTLVTDSEWLAGCARSSSLVAHRRIEAIPHGLPLDVYKPIDRAMARRVLNLPHDRILILFSANNGTSDPNKGFHLLRPALERLAATCHDAMDLVVVGASSGKGDCVPGMVTHWAGYLRDEVTLALMYSAADVFVLPSLSETLPSTVMEALACGTPSVAFNVGGNAELITHQENGYLVPPYDVEALAEGISWVISDSARRRTLGEEARRTVEARFDVRQIAKRYVGVYESVLR